MPRAVRRYDGEHFESILRRFKRAVEKDNTMADYRKHEFYVKPSVKRKLAKEAARKRHLRDLREAEQQAEDMDLNK